MSTQPTQFQLSNIPADVIRQVNTRARRQAAERLHATGEMLDAAEQIVAAGYVILTGRNIGLVYDPAGVRLGGGWLDVSRSYCPHCNDTRDLVVCRHTLAVWLADALARQAPKPETQPIARPELVTGAGAPGTSQAGGLGAATGGHIGTAGSSQATGRRAQGQCPHCAGWLTKEGACHKCGWRKGI